MLIEFNLFHHAWRSILCFPHFCITLQLVNPAFQDVLGHIRWGMLEKFKASFDKALGIGEGFSSASQDWFKACMTQFDEECAGAIIEQANWDTSKVRDKLVRDIEAHITSVRTSKLSELTSLYEVTERVKKAWEIELCY